MVEIQIFLSSRYCSCVNVSIPFGMVHKSGLPVICNSHIKFIPETEDIIVVSSGLLLIYKYWRLVRFERVFGKDYNTRLSEIVRLFNPFKYQISDGIDALFVLIIANWVNEHQSFFANTSQT